MWEIDRVVSKGDYNYAVVYAHPNRTRSNYVLHHRVIVENHIGRLLTSEEVVHHKNENKKDNRIENLELMSLVEHSRMHQTTGRTVIQLVCYYCDAIFEREVRRVTKSFNVFCSKRCSGKHSMS